MTAILGISAFYHDSAAALVVDGDIVAAAQEERFTRKKHDLGFPQHAIDYCLAEAGISPERLDYVGFYDKPLMKFERLLETYLAFVPAGYRSFRKAMPLWLRQKLHLPREMNRGLRGGYRRRYVFTDHHESHAASAFFPSPFDEAAILTFDGVGEWSTTCYGVGRGNKIELTHEIRFPHSLGLLYSAFTYYTGFRVNSGEYKLMGLAPYGQPGLQGPDSRAPGGLEGRRLVPHGHELLQLLPGSDDDLAEVPPAVRRPAAEAGIGSHAAGDGPGRFGAGGHRGDHAPDGPACSIAQTGLQNLVLAGGVALNCVGNGRILREGPFENLWIQPAAGDAGGALGTALFIWHQLLDQPRNPGGRDRQKGSFLGPSFSEAEIGTTLRARQATFTTCADDAELCDLVADLIVQEKVVGWFQGRMEFGPRALGARSILGDARSKKMQSVMNLKIKFRESFRPFAPDRAAGTRRSVLSKCGLTKTAPTCCWSRRSGKKSARRSVRTTTRPSGLKNCTTAAPASRPSPTWTIRLASRPSTPTATRCCTS